MKMNHIPFGITDWSRVETTIHPGERGEATWQTRYFGEGHEKVRVRMVCYSSGYLADHWCVKGHILLCLEGNLETELEDGRRFTLTAGMSYQVADNAEAHRSSTEGGARLFIVD
jgi:quercetin dioxygenase-like cupin family protein